MIEFRTLVRNRDGSRVLQFRTAVAIDASGALCPGEWSKWITVPEVMEGKHALSEARAEPPPKKKGQ